MCMMSEWLYFYMFVMAVIGSASASLGSDAVKLSWPCAGTCWSHPSGVILHDVMSHLWNCSHCDSCDYGNYQNYENGCIDCGALYTQNKVMIPTIPISTGDVCNIDLYSTCRKNYYKIADGPCTECKNSPNALDCGDGKYPKRCISDSDYQCDQCDYPEILDNVMYKYGSGSLFDDCSSFGSIVDASNCAWHLTPKWNVGKCEILCNSGYVPISAAGDFPVCNKCETSCPLGSKPPTCLGGRTPEINKRGKCEPCNQTITLPDHAEWLPDCAWKCSEKGYRLSDNSQGCEECIPSLATSCQEGYYFMGCKNGNQGQCVACSVTCQKGISYLKNDIYLDTCTCADCTRPVTGTSYTRTNCTNMSDAVVVPCSSVCETGYYKTKDCTLWADIVCVKCTGAKRGFLLNSQCKYNQDAVYGPCPSARACDGSNISYMCSNGRFAVNGLCSCPNATAYDEGTAKCYSIDCGLNGLYPNVKTGKCSNCSASSASLGVQVISRKGILGLDACGCPSGYFVEKNVQLGVIQCWPCGDLGCSSNLQRQTECLGFDLNEPVCTCAPAPGSYVDALSTEMCSLRCSARYLPTVSDTTTTIFSGLYDKFNFFSSTMSGTSQQKTTRLIFEYDYNTWDTFANIYGYKMMVVLDSEIALVLHNNGKNLTAIYLDTAVAVSLDLSILQYGSREFAENVVITSIVAHEGTGVSSLAWISFTFGGNCVDVEDKDRKLNCSAVELISVQKLSDLDTKIDKFCAKVGINICIKINVDWGKYFVSTGTSRKIHAMTLSGDGTTLYLLLGDFDKEGGDSIVYYNVIFYSPITLPHQRDSDLLSEPITNSIPTSLIKDIAIGVRGIYALFADSRIALYSTSENVWTQLEWWIINNSGDNNNTVSQNLDEIANWDNLFEITHNLLAVQSKTTGKLSFLELWNHMASSSDNFPFSHVSPYGLPTIWAYRRSDINTLVALNGTHLWVLNGAAFCSIDTISYSKGSSCVPVKCRYFEPCGPNSVRSLGASFCGCKPGFKLTPPKIIDGNVHCVACSSSLSESLYCPGGTSVALTCPLNSLSRSLYASNVLDCQCQPGYYHFSSLCLPCPVNMWCPMNGTTTPIPCFARGSTKYEGALSPLSCICPPRTHGITCEPCGDDVECVSLAPSTQITLLSVYVNGWGPIWGQEIPSLCLFPLMGGDTSAYLIYYMYEAGDSTNTNFDSAMINSDTLFWSWTLVIKMEGIITLPDAASIFGNITSCISVYGFRINTYNILDTKSGQDLSTQGIILRETRTCGGYYWEWNGLESQSDCTCIEGYEKLKTSKFSSSQCFPCMNGTVRPRRSIYGCTACTGIYEHAPFLGMKKCTCIDGYVRSTLTELCEDRREIEPSWYPELSSPNIVIIIAFGIGGILMITSIFCGLFF